MAPGEGGASQGAGPTQHACSQEFMVLALNSAVWISFCACNWFKYKRQL